MTGPPKSIIFNHFPKRLLSLVIGVLFFSSTIFAQLNIEAGDQGIYSPEELVRQVFLGTGVSIVDINYRGNRKAVGSYTGLLDFIPLQDGLMITTGAAYLGQNQNNSTNLGALWNDQTLDADLSAIASDPIEDLAYYEITFVPDADRIAFKYAFASEEYPEFACTDFNDVFGFFLTGPNPTGGNYQAENIAWIPDPSDPSGFTFTNIPVSINSVNGNGIDPLLGCVYDFTTYYNVIDQGNFPTYDAYLDPFWAVASVIPCETYTIKIGIADVSDDEYDSAIFLEGNSFSSNQPTISFANHFNSNTFVEGCDQLSLQISFPFPLTEGVSLNIGLFGTAENNNDFSPIDPVLFIQAGQTSQTLLIDFLADGIIEGRETLGIIIEGCNPDTLWIDILDSNTSDPGFPEVISRCTGPVQIAPTNDLSKPSDSFSNSQTATIPILSNSNDFDANPLISSIEVQGLEDINVVAQNIESVCVDISHALISQVDIYLRSPYGKIVALSTNNGGATSDLPNVCFTPTAAVNIDNAPPPFSGDYLPQVDFTTLDEPNENPDGTWDLIVKDNVATPTGELLSWYITFNTAYSPSYTWTPTTGLSCTDCPNPIADPPATTTYTVSFDDPFGCPQSYEVRVEREFSTAPAITQELDCPGSSNALITAEVLADGIPPFQFNWGTLGLDSIAGPVGAGSYAVTISDSNGCTAEQEIIVSDPDSIQVNFESSAPCFNMDPSGFILAIPTNGQPSYNFQWSSNAGGSTNESISNLLPGLYQLTVSDSKGCSVQEEFTLEEGTLELSYEVHDVSCFGENDGAIDLEIIGGTEPFNYELNGENMGNFPNLSFLTAGNYNLKITDANGCELNAPPIIIQQPDSFYVDLGEDRTITLGQRPLLDINISNAAGNSDTWEWNWNERDEEFLTCLGCTFPRIENLDFQQTFELTIIDSIGCQASDQILIRINKPRRFFVPNGFTPNDDNLNDLLLTHGDESAMVLSFILYDRWGAPVFTASDFSVGDPSIGWDGKKRDGFADPGVYVWVAQVEFRDGARVQFNGECTLIR